MTRAILFRALPNLITLMRCFLVPVIVLLILSRDFAPACLAFAIAGLSDALDGWLARHFHLRTALGALLDPVADKALLVSIYATMATIGAIPVWLTIIVIARDIAIVSAVILSWLMSQPMEIRPALVSKLNTLAQIVYAGLALANQALVFDGRLFGLPLLGLCGDCVALLTLASGGVYLWRWLLHFDLRAP